MTQYFYGETKFPLLFIYFWVKILLDAEISLISCFINYLVGNLSG